jgi:hypothetical protein
MSRLSIHPMNFTLSPSQHLGFLVTWLVCVDYVAAMVSHILQVREADAHTYYRAVGRRSLVAALLIVSLLAFYTLRSPSDLDSIPSQAPQSAPEVARPVVHDPASPEPTHLSESASLPSLKPPRCAVTKVSMLYGAHKFSQLENALEVHRRHSERWGCGFESLDRDLTTRKLYSKHYFLMSTMLHELSKPEEERQEWL